MVFSIIIFNKERLPASVLARPTSIPFFVSILPCPVLSSPLITIDPAVCVFFPWRRRKEGVVSDVRVGLSAPQRLNAVNHHFEPFAHLARFVGSILAVLMIDR